MAGSGDTALDERSDSHGAGRLLRFPFRLVFGTPAGRLLVAVVVVKWLLLDVYLIPSRSMMPTLDPGEGWATADRVAVNKLAYGVRVPFTSHRLFSTGAPQRWDVVVLRNMLPDLPESVMIKRIAGLPGERVRIMRGSLYVNGEEVSLPERASGAKYFTGLGLSLDRAFDVLLVLASDESAFEEIDRESEIYGSYFELAVNQLREALAGRDLDSLTPDEKGWLRAMLDPDTIRLMAFLSSQSILKDSRGRFGIQQDDASSVIPAGHYYLLGDNGLESVDGRYYGWAPESYLFGRAFAIIYPFERARDLSGFLETAAGLWLLWIVLLALVMWELVWDVFFVSVRADADVPSFSIGCGDRVIAARRSFRRRLGFGARVLPAAGDVVVFRVGRWWRRRTAVGRITKTIHDGDVAIETVSLEGSREVALSERQVVGKVLCIWWPLRHARSLRH